MIAPWVAIIGAIMVVARPFHSLVGGSVLSFGMSPSHPYARNITGLGSARRQGVSLCTSVADVEIGTPSNTASEDSQTDRELFIPIPDHVTTMVQAGKLEALLTQHPNQSLVKFVVNGFREDFDIGYRGNLSPGATSNLRSATLHHGNVSKEGTRPGSCLRSFQITTNYSNINVPCGQYQKYLESPDGGRRELQSEKQSASEVFRIYQSLPNATIAKFVYHYMFVSILLIQLL